jgi:hypothetical protein
VSRFTLTPISKRERERERERESPMRERECYEREIENMKQGLYTMHYKLVHVMFTGRTSVV